jgi:hypothetical protein
MVAASRDSETDRPRRFWSLFVFSPSADAFSRDDEGDGDEGVLCWWSCRPCLCVFLAFDCILLMAFSALPLSRFFLSFFSRFSLFSPLFFSFSALLFAFFPPTVNLPYLTVTLANERNSLFSAFFYSVFGCFFFLFSPFFSSFMLFFFLSFSALSLPPLARSLEGFIYSLEYLYLGKI